MSISWKRATLLTLLLAVLLSQSCTRSDSYSGQGGDATFVGKLPESDGRPLPPDGDAGLLAERVSADAAGSADYHLASLDVLDIAVFRVPELSKTVQVSSSGRIVLPLIGSIAAAGKTTTQLESEIAHLLGEKYLQSPQVSVSVKEATSQRITVTGAVQQPGVFPIVGPTTLLQTIAMAKGIDDVADSSSIVVFRTISNKKMAARFDLDEISSGKTKDPLILAGDMVVVDKSGTRATLRDITRNLAIVSTFAPLAAL